VPELQEHLKQRGLPPDGKKEALRERLLEWIAEQQHDDGASDAGDEDEDEPVQRSVTGRREPARLARAAGVCLEWHLMTCPSCKVQLTARLQAASNVVQCAYCLVVFDCANRDIAAHPPQPPAPIQYRKRGPSMRFRTFMSMTMQRLIADANEEGGEGLVGRLQRKLFGQAHAAWRAMLAAETAAATGAEQPAGQPAELPVVSPAEDVSMGEGMIGPTRLIAERPQPMVPAVVPVAERPSKKRRQTPTTHASKKLMPPQRAPLSPCVGTGNT
jgi:hypothetical protein